MRKTLFVLAMILLLMLTACSAKETLPTDSDSEDTILILAPTESESDTDPTESVKEAVGSGETESSSQTEESQPQKSEDTNSETTVQDTTKPPVVSKEQENTSQTDDTSKSESSTPPTETIHPPATESTASEKEPPETETVTPTVEQPSSSEVASLVAVYVNQYRSSPATVLPGLSNVASYRANQLVTNFAHSDGIDACNALQYGEFVDMTLYGMSESDSYYQGYNREAIAKGNWGGTADEIAQRIATGFKNSSRHWSYLGSNEYCYIAVGCIYDEASSMWCCCICVSSKNYGG